MAEQGCIQALRWPLWGIFLLAFLAALTFAKALFLPVLLAMLLSLTLSPIVRSLRRKGVPESLSAGLLVVIVTFGFAFAVSFVAEPFSNWIERFPTQFLEVKQRLSGLFEKLSLIQNASDSISGAVDSEAGQPAAAVKDNGDSIVAMAASNVLSIATTTLVTMVLTYFLLAKGRLFYTKVLETTSSLKDKKEVLSTVYSIERGVSRYLFTITLINICLGFVIFLAMWMLGMPSPMLWGIAAAILNFLPYIGALMGIIGSGVVAILTFDTLPEAFLIPVVYAALTSIEGQVITPTYVGKSLAINPVVIFLSLALWSFMWGLAGALIAVPLLVVFHTIARNIDQLAWFSHFISDQNYSDRDN